MKIHIKQFNYNCLVGLLPLAVTLLGTPAIAGEISTPDRCNNIGRILISWDSGIPENSIICQDAQITVGKQLKVYAACTKNEMARWLPSGTYQTNQLCSTERLPKKQCLLALTCWRTSKGLEVIYPKSFSSIEPDSKLRWKPIASADQYEILVTSSNGQQFTQFSSEPKYQFANEYALIPGNIYKIQVVALEKQKVLQETTFSLNVLSESMIEELNLAIHAAENNIIPLQERLQLIDSIYMSLGLDHQAIEYLEGLQTLENSPILSRLLGDRYLKLGLRKKAIQNYRQVLILANKNSEHFKYANEMLSNASENLIM